jgi:hypothetical protein
MAFSLLSKGDIEILKDKILYMTDVRDEVIQVYCRQFGGVVPASSMDIHKFGQGLHKG